MNGPSLTLFVLRKDSDDDDIIRIQRSRMEPSLYLLSYTDTQSSHTGTRKIALTATEIQTYIRTLMQALSLDADPFEFLQITPPAFPSVQYSVSSLNDFTVQQSILNTVRMSLDSWPRSTASVEQERSTTPVRRSSRIASTQV